MTRALFVCLGRLPSAPSRACAALIGGAMRDAISDTLAAMRSASTSLSSRAMKGSAILLGRGTGMS